MICIGSGTSRYLCNLPTSAVADSPFFVYNINKNKKSSTVLQLYYRQIVMIMARFDKTVKPSAAIPRRKSSLGRRENSNSSIHETNPTRHLIVTTTKGVFTWGNQGVKKIFASGSGGIVAARRVKNGGSLLAVADSQVVILHDTRKGMQKSYKLRGSDVSQ